jgi:hypothetical protein
MENTMKNSGKWIRSGCGSVALLAICAVTSTAAFALEDTFNHPTYKKLARLDVCYVWGRECGKKPADTYCRAQGYDWSVRFDTEPVRPTRLASDGKICDAEFCVGFKSITCFTRASQRGAPGGWPQRIDPG